MFEAGSQNDLTVVMQLINEQKELEKLKKTHISID